MRRCILTVFLAPSQLMAQLCQASVCFCCGSELLISWYLCYHFPSRLALRGCILQLYDIQQSISTRLCTETWHMADIIIGHTKPVMSQHSWERCCRQDSLKHRPLWKSDLSFVLIWREWTKKGHFTLCYLKSFKRFSLTSRRRIWSTGCWRRCQSCSY